jgi:hypothetical protein
MEKKYTREFLEPLVKKHISFRGILTELNVRGGTDYLSGVIKKLGLDTSHFTYGGATPVAKVCSKCGIFKEINSFYEQADRPSRMVWCKECLNSSTYKRQLLNKVRAVILSGGKCVHCGYNKCISALEFHHTNPENKERVNNGRLASRRWERYWEEKKKCILLCANCHREEEENLRARSAADSATLS